MITLAHLLIRRRVLAGARARHRPAPRVAPPPLPPSGAIVAYTAMLTELGRALDAEALATLRHAGAVARTDGVLPWLSSGLAALLALLARRLLDRAAAPLWVTAVERVGRATLAHTGLQFARQVQTVVGIDPGPQGLDLVPQLRAWREQQLGLITSLATDKVDKVREVLERHGVGARHELLAADIERETGTTPARAAVIARSQVLALNAQLTEARHRAAGITQFVWSTSHDARVRPEHRALDGRTFDYAAPPVIDGEPTLPGRSPNCRCVAVPVIAAGDSSR